MSILYDRIAMLCEKRGITGYRLCKDIGISPSVITDLKSGRKKGMSADYSSRIADYFGVSVSYLLGAEAEPIIQIEGDTREEWLEDARSRPELKVLFSATKGMTREQVEKTASWIAEMRKGWD